ncbi:TetR/AcrR family transcriptional regulator [Microvirga antarctica]|uniref:TetR/AcrR family transcriptional regulator n=1 Tax=Microvirga antarctica TaxID=2819233 RepID=UPI001B30336E|nr:TetR/AcrR family transcriptional regulator [Microvirga antarctica]
MNRPIVSQVQNEKLIVDRRERIIRAAITVFRRSGFHVATTKDIAHEAELTQSNLYNYVRSKHDVLFLVCEHLVQLYQDAVDETVLKHEDSHSRLVEALRSVIRVMSAHRDEVQLLYNETHALEKADRKIILSSIAKLIKSFQILLKDYEQEYGPCLVANQRIAANLLSFVPAIVALRSWDLSAHAERPEIEEAVFAFILAGLNIPSQKQKPKQRRKPSSLADGSLPL